jgi:acetyl-CoA acetyltransferase
VGIGSTDFTSCSGRSELTLAAQAALAALADAGLTPGDLDGIVRSDLDVVTERDLVQTLGLYGVTYWGQSGPGGKFVGGGVGQAVGAILGGQATTVLLVQALNGRSGRRLGRLRPKAGQRVGGNTSYDEFFVPYGLTSAAQLFALVARRHMEVYGTTGKHLGQIAVELRNRANANPRAQMFGKSMSLEDYESSRWIARPLRMLDCCIQTDGACALIVTSADRAKDARGAPVLIRAVAQAAGGPTVVQGGHAGGSLMRENLTSFGSNYVADSLYKRAGLGPTEVDVAQFYDCFTIALLIQLEDYGFCKPGEGGPFVATGRAGLDGDLPINTSGGHLSEGYIPGMNQVLEGVRQLRGESTSQVPGAEVCLVTSAPPGASAAMILRKG